MYHIKQRDDASIIEVNGALDDVSSEALASAIALAELSLERRVVVSLVGCSKCDWAALRVLIAAKTRLEARLLVVVSRRSRLNRIFDASGLTKRLSLCTSMGEALGKSIPITVPITPPRPRPASAQHNAYGAPPRRRSESVSVAKMLLPNAYADILPLMRAMAARGASLREIAAKLEADGHPTRAGYPWNAIQVSRALARL